MSRDPDFSLGLSLLAQREGGGSQLYDALLASIPGVVEIGNFSNRAIIVFTAGEDNSSTGTLDEVIASAKSNDVRIFSVGLGQHSDDVALTVMAHATGGISSVADTPESLISYYSAVRFSRPSPRVSRAHRRWR